MHEISSFISASAPESRQRAGALVDFIYLCEGNTQQEGARAFIARHLQRLNQDIQKEMREAKLVTLEPQAHAELLNTWFNDRRSLLLLRSHIGKQTGREDDSLEETLNRVIQDSEARQAALTLIEAHFERKPGFFGRLLDMLLRLGGSRYG